MATEVIQTRILRTIYFNRRPMDVWSLCTKTHLSVQQIHRGIVNLRQRGLVKKVQVRRKAGFGKPPIVKILVYANEKEDYRIRKLLMEAQENSQQ